MTKRHQFFSLNRRSWQALLASLALGAALLVGTVPALAHHGWSGYDSSTLLTLTGTIAAVQYENPHVMVTLDVAEEPEEDVEGEAHAEGEIEDPPSVTVVMAPPFRSESRGLSRDMLVPGVTATFEGYLHKTTAMELRAERIRIGDLTVELR
jgi:hypothetical protein